MTKKFDGDTPVAKQTLGDERIQSDRLHDETSTTTSHTSLQTLFSQGILPSISRELYLAAKEAPREDPTFTFPYDALEKAFSKLFSIQHISIRPINEENPSWIESETCLERFHNIEAELFHITIEGVHTPLFVQFPQSLYNSLFEMMLGSHDARLALNDPGFFTKFRSFFQFQAMAALRSIPEVSRFSPTLHTIVKTEEKPSIQSPGPCFCTIVDFSVQNTVLGQIAVYASSRFLEDWRKIQKPSLEHNIALFRKTLRIPVSIELGRTFIQKTELLSLQEGDLFLIEHPFYRPGTEKTRAILTVKGMPIFKAKIKDGGMKVLEMPIQYEVFNYPGGAELHTEALPSKNVSKIDSFDSSEGETMSSHNQSQAEDEETKDLSAASLSDIDIGENPFEGDDPLDDEDNGHNTSDPDRALLEKSKAYLPPEKVDVTAIPHTVVIQLTQMNMTVEELASLSSGNIIQLDVQPEDPVSLVIQNRVIALGDLVMIGDHIGVRIREMNLLETSVS